MNNHMTIDQIISAAKSDINRQIKKGSFTGMEEANDDEENFETITSLYSQWAIDTNEAESKLWEMYEEDYPQYFIDSMLNDKFDELLDLE